MIDARLKTFLILCEVGNYTRTSAMLNLTQPAVTQHIKYLENYYGAKLFYYDENRQLCLTKKGHLLQSYAQTFLADASILEQVMKLPDEISYCLNLGVLSSAGETAVMHAIANYMHEFPHTKIAIQLGETSDLLNSLKSGDIQACVVDSYGTREEFESAQLFSTDVICVCSTKHPLAGKTVDFDMLANNRLVFREESSSSHMNLVSILHSHNRDLNDFLSYVEVGSIYAVKKLIMEDVGVSFIYRYIVQEDLDSGMLKEIRVRDFHYRSYFNLVWMKHSAFEGNIMQFLEVFKGMLGSF